MPGIALARNANLDQWEDYLISLICNCHHLLPSVNKNESGDTISSLLSCLTKLVIAFDETKLNNARCESASVVKAAL